MNYLSLPEYADLAAASTAPSFPSSHTSPSSLERLVANIHRRAAAPRGYRFVANIAVADFARAVRAVKLTETIGEVRLITPAVDDAGNHVPDIALYVRNHLPEPEFFWAMFHSLDQQHAA